MLLFLITVYGIPHSIIQDVQVEQREYCQIQEGLISPASYQRNTRTGEVKIIICKGASAKDIIHEVGHVVCEKEGNPYPFGKGERGDFTSYYAQTNKQEDCAETFTDYYYYKYDCANLRQTAKKSKLLLKKCLHIRKWHLKYLK